VIEEEKQEGGEYYWKLVEELEQDEYVSQKTYEDSTQIVDSRSDLKI
jgi:hypothetical protein